MKKLAFSVLKDLLRACFLILVTFAINEPSYVIASETHEESSFIKQSGQKGFITDPLYSGTVTENFIIRWAFQDLCDFVFDLGRFTRPTNKGKQVTFDPALVKKGDIILVRDAGTFFDTMHPLIQEAYVIVTHGEAADAMQEGFRKFLDDPKIIAWFGIHPDTWFHPKYYPIPLGIYGEPVLYKNKGKLHHYFSELRMTAIKKHLLYLNFYDHDIPERLLVRNLFSDKKYCLCAGQKKYENYLAEMSECKFTLSPRGIGIDCYRTWESLLVGSIPIVRTSQLDSLFEGLPVLIIEKWEDINEDFLLKKYEEIMSKRYDLRKLYLEYWFSKIINVRNEFLARLKTNGS